MDGESGQTMPFLVSCANLFKWQLTHKKVDEIVKKVEGRAQAINFNLFGNKNPKPSTVRYLWENYGLLTEIKIKSPKEKAFWDEQQLPYLGITDNDALATPFSKELMR